MPNLNNSIINAVVQWDLDARAIRTDIEICGSPERCEFRFVIECTNDDLYVIESLVADDICNKKKIISSLNHLFGQGLAGINPYLPAKDGAYIVEAHDRFWQISRFIDGTPLKRPEYVFDRWRGSILADFLIDLRTASSDISGFEGKSPFSIIDYIITLNNQIRTYEPKLQKKIQPITDFLQKDLFPTHDRLPVVFCHGDFHVLNVIWSDTGINAVIDWEFSGMKPDIYDMANMIGCIGIENPDALAGPLVTDFIHRLNDSGRISNRSWSKLAEFVVALRFAWLAEWLRHKDHEMIDLELAYLDLLVKNSDDLKQFWEI